MQSQDGSPNPHRSSPGQGPDEIVVETVLSDNNDDDNVRTFTFSSTEEGTAGQENMEQETNIGQARGRSREEVPPRSGRLPTQPSPIARDQPINIGQAFPGLWETGTVDRETPRRSQAPATASVESSGRQSQTIEFDDGEIWERPLRRSSATIQQMIDNARRQSAVTFNSPPSISRLNQTGGLLPINSTAFTSFPDVTPVVSNPMLRTRAGNPGQDPDSSSSDSDDDDGPPGLVRPVYNDNESDDDSTGLPDLLDREEEQERNSHSDNEPEVNEDEPQARPQRTRQGRGIRCLNCGMRRDHTTNNCPHPPQPNRHQCQHRQPVPQPMAPHVRVNPPRPNPICEHCGRNHLTARCPSQSTRDNPNGPVIDGRRLQVRTNPVPINNYICQRNWNKLQRWMLEADERMKFIKEASGYVLSKTNKLRVQSQLTADDEVLKNIYNLQFQIKALKNHAIEYDIADVFTIVVPVDVRASPRLQPEQFNLFDDYPKLTSEMVALSNAYYSRWVAETYISENLTITEALIKNNTEESLYCKCWEAYETYHPMQRGGPLLLHLILQRIHNASEQYLEHIKLKVETLRISELEGENVDVAVSLINAAHSIFISSSTANQSRIPPEWSKTLIRVFQTTTVPEFNQVFKEEEKDARRDADKNGGQPVWPTHEQLTRLATVTYNRIKQSGYWDIPTKKSKGYLNAPAGKGSPTSNPDYRCWNCGEPGHRLDACPKPRNQARIDAERVKFRAKRSGKRDGPRRPPRKPQAKAATEGSPSDSSKKKKKKKSKADKALPARDNPDSRPQAAPAVRPATESHATDHNRLYDPYTVQSILHELL